MPRHTGDYSGSCDRCGEYLEFAMGLPAQGEPVAMLFGPDGPRNIELRDVQLAVMVDDDIDIRFEFACPLCGQWSAGRATCRPAGGPP